MKPSDALALALALHRAAIRQIVGKIPGIPAVRRTDLARLSAKESRPMNTSSYAEAIYQRSLQLPEQAAQEALDFIDFLLLRYGTELGSNQATFPRRDASAFLAAVAGTWGADFPDDISDADLAADTPRDNL